MNKKKTSLFKKFFFIGLIGFLFWILLQNNLLNKFDFETELKFLLDDKKNLSKDEFYNNLSKLHDKLEKKLKQEYGSVHSIEYALDFKCLNDCKSKGYNNKTCRTNKSKISSCINVNGFKIHWITKSCYTLVKLYISSPSI